MVSEVLPALALLAGAMAGGTAYLVKLAGTAQTRAQAGVALFLLAMMAEMLVGAAVGLQIPGPHGLVAALSVSGGLMAASAGTLFLAIAPVTTRSSSPSGGIAFLAAVIVLVLVGEGLMAWTFGTASGTGPGFHARDLGGAATLLGQVLVSPWFVLTMASEMAVATALLWSRLSGALRVLLPLQSVLMALAPPAFSSAQWVSASVVAGSVAMIALFVYQMEYLYRHRQLGSVLSRYFVALIGSYALMMVGLVVWQVYGWPVPFAASLVVEMAVYLSAALAPPAEADRVTLAWQQRPGWTFAVLLLIFVAELGMGAVLDLNLQPGQFSGQFFDLPLAGTVPTILYNALYDGFWFFARVAGSTWFLAMMGAEMGALVVLKIRETRDRETRFRLGLMIASYAAFAVFFPSMYYGQLFPRGPGAVDPTSVPVLGWSMGVGSAPVAASVFGVLLATYAATAVLSLLFGRRWLCSVFCTAPLMFQGTTLDATKSFNRTSPVARRFLGSRFSAAYSVTLTVVMVALALASLTSYLDQAGALHVTVLGSDPSVFLFALSFNVMWYVLFVTIPYVGNYNCVTMGWCYTGNIAAAFGRLGFFRLKVKDREVCRQCTTVDCARACPVGLVDMPLQFRQKGEFRSSKCCGVGDCIGACPYGNMYIRDVRHWWRRLRGLPEYQGSGPRLPMVGSRAPSPPLGLRPARTNASPAPTPHEYGSTSSQRPA